MESQDIRKLKLKLESEAKKSSKVFIIGHNNPDFDSMGSCIGIYTILKYLGKEAYIIVNDDDVKLQPGIKKIMDETRLNYKFIKKGEFELLVDKNSLLIVTDVNKKDMISVGDELDKFRSIIIIDHHSENENTIDTKNKFIRTDVSSVSEIVARLLFTYKFEYKNTANYLLAGINLDTKRFKQNTSAKTHDVAEKLIDKGADIDYVNNLFLEEFESFCRISNLIINGTVIKQFSESLAPIQVSFTLNRNNPHEIYLQEDYAKAADRMMKFSGIDASFALGYVDEDTVHISARGGKKVNVGKIMTEMHGGGNQQSAAAKISSCDICEIEERLMEKIPIGLIESEEEQIYDEPKVIKVKQVKKFMKKKEKK